MSKWTARSKNHMPFPYRNKHTTVQVPYARVLPSQLVLRATTEFEHMFRIGQNHIYIRFIYGIFGRESTKYTVIYGVYIRFWPTLHMFSSQ